MTKPSNIWIQLKSPPELLELTLTPPKLFCKIEKERTILNSIFKPTLLLHKKTKRADKDLTKKKENYRLI